MLKNKIISLLMLIMPLGLSLMAQDESSLQDPRQARIAVVIPEIHIAAPIPDPAAETAILRKFLEAGFTRMVDQNQVNKIRDRDVVKSIMAGDAKAAQSMAMQLGVDYIVVGEAFSERVPGTVQNMVSCRARVEARIIRTDNGTIIAAHGFHAGGLDMTEFTSAKKALNNAGEMMGDYLVQQVSKRGEITASGIKLTVAGVFSYARVNELLKALQGLTGAVQSARVAEYSAGVAVFDLTVSVSAQTLAGRLSELLSPRLEVTEVSGSAMKVSMR